MIYQRAELSGLAELTIAKSERIVTKLKELVAGNRELDSGTRNLLRDMRSLLRFSEEKLKEAEDTISILIKKSVLSGKLLLSKETLELEAIIIWRIDALNIVKQDVFGGNLEDRAEKDDQDLFEEIEELIEDGDFVEIYDAFNHLKDTAKYYEMLPDLHSKFYDIVF